MSTGGFSFRRLFIVDDAASKKDGAPSTASTNIDALLNDALHPASSVAPAAPATHNLPTTGTDQDLVLIEGVELNAIYEVAEVPVVPFTIEKLAKLVDGLNQLDSATKRTAVAAMDAADDSWDIQSVIADGKAKIGAIEGYKAEISATEKAISDEISRRLEINAAEKAQRLADIDAQIAALQAQREQAISDSASEAANLRAQGVAAAEAAERERTRLSNAIRGFNGLVTLFDANTTLPTA